jgi:ABC-2 type transport system permease protein
VVDEDQSDESKAYVKKLQESEALTVKHLDLPTAQDQVRKGKLSAFLRVEKGFGDSTFGSSTEGLLLELGVDPARRAAKAYLQGILMRTWFDSTKDMFSNPMKMRQLVTEGLRDIDQSTGISKSQRDVFNTFLANVDRFLGDVDPEVYSKNEPLGNMEIKTVSVIRDEARPRNPFDITFPSGILWGLIGCATAFGISIVNERSSGTLLRIRLSPLGRAPILGGKGLACFAACVGVAVFLIFIGVVFFKVQLSDPLKATLAIFSTAICFVGIMMLISVMGKTERAVSGAGWAILLVMAMFGGCMIPLAFMPGWMQTISHLSPVKWCILALEGAIWRQFSYAEMVQPCGILVIIGVVFFTAGVKIFARSGQKMSDTHV